MDIPLSTLFHRALITASKAYALPTIQDETQDLIQSSLPDLRTVLLRITALSLFSPNETLADIATRDLVYLFVPYVLADVNSRVRAIDVDERLELAIQNQNYLKGFVSSLEGYEIVSEQDWQLYGQNASSVRDPAKRRELKIKQYQKEKEIRGRIEILRKRRRQSSTDEEPSTDLEQIASLLPAPSQSQPSSKGAPQEEKEEEEEQDTEDVLRETTLLLLRLLHGSARTTLESTERELELLRRAPREKLPVSSAAQAQAASFDSRLAKAREEDEMWRLDAMGAGSGGGLDGRGPLLDPQGKPLRPFTILPSSADRVRLQAQVFQPDHRLPSMTIDEYLEIEQQRGNIITGGGPRSEKEPTTSEQLALDAEMDGTAFGEVKAEEKRLKDERWAQYTDAHPRGAGNTMNRG